MKQKVQFRTSIASSDWSFQSGQVAEVDADLAAKWIRSGVAVAVNGTLPVTDFYNRDGLADLDAEQALRFPCVHCSARASFVFQNRGLQGINVYARSRTTWSRAATHERAVPRSQCWPRR